MIGDASILEGLLREGLVASYLPVTDSTCNGQQARRWWTNSVQP